MRYRHCSHCAHWDDTHRGNWTTREKASNEKRTLETIEMGLPPERAHRRTRNWVEDQSGRVVEGEAR